MKAVLCVLSLLAAAVAVPSRAADDLAAERAFVAVDALNDAVWLYIFEKVKAKDMSFAVSLRSELRLRALSDAGLDFVTRFPADPRAAQVLTWMVEAKPSYLVGFRPTPDESDIAAYQKAAIYDPAGSKQWRQSIAEATARVAAAKGRPKNAEERLAYAQAKLAIDAAFRALEAGEPVDVGNLRRQVKRFADMAPDERGLSPAQVDALLGQDNFRLLYGDDVRHIGRRGAVLSSYFYLLEQFEPQSVAAEAKPYLNSPNEQTRKVAEAKMASAAIRIAPVDLKFTALDGREVDLAQLRGKPVLIEFWATYCGPCIAQIPDLKQLYANYHARGFQIISVSTDLAADRERLLKLIAKNELPWPQHFAGPAKRGDKHELAARFGVKGIPASYLLDRSGRIVTVNLRGKKLEEAVRQQLGD